MKTYSPHNRLPEHAHAERLRVVCEGLRDGLSFDAIASRFGVSGASINSWTRRHAAFLLTPGLVGNAGKEERARRAALFLDTGKRAPLYSTPVDQGQTRSCRRVKGWVDGEAVYCGKTTTRHLCVLCEAKLNHAHLPAVEGERVVRLNRGLRA
ncbi:MAG: hypothetical protein WBF53_11965 [Litorimonas sp.]